MPRHTFVLCSKDYLPIKTTEADLSIINDKIIDMMISLHESRIDVFDSLLVKLNREGSLKPLVDRMKDVTLTNRGIKIAYWKNVVLGCPESDAWVFFIKKDETGYHLLAQGAVGKFGTDSFDKSHIGYLSIKEGTPQEFTKKVISSLSNACLKRRLSPSIYVNQTSVKFLEQCGFEKRCTNGHCSIMAMKV